MQSRLCKSQLHVRVQYMYVYELGLPGVMKTKPDLINFMEIFY